MAFLFNSYAECFGFVADLYPAFRKLGSRKTWAYVVAETVGLSRDEKAHVDLAILIYVMKYSEGIIAGIDLENGVDRTF